MIPSNNEVVVMPKDFFNLTNTISEHCTMFHVCWKLPRYMNVDRELYYLLKIKDVISQIIIHIYSSCSLYYKVISLQHFVDILVANKSSLIMQLLPFPRTISWRVFLKAGNLNTKQII